MTRPGDGGSSGPPSGDSPGSQSTTYEAHGHCWWPQGDPDRLEAAAAAWEAAAKGIQRVAGDGDTAVRSVTTHNSGDAVDTFSAFWSTNYSGGSDTATLTQSAEACLQIAHVCQEHADGIRRARKEVIALAVAAAATVAVGLVLTFVSFGASDVAAEGAAAAITAEALALEETFSTLLMGVIRTAAMGALKGAAFSMAYDSLVVQPIEMHFEPGRHFSIDEVGEWGLQGAVFGGAFSGAAASVRALRMAEMLEVSPAERLSGGAIKAAHNEIDREVRWADEAYDKIRATDDVESVANSSGWSAERVQAVKDHVFYNLQKLDDGRIARFDADADMADAWQRLVDGKPVQADLDLLAHEEAELKYLAEHPVDYRTAHNAVLDQSYTWDPPAWQPPPSPQLPR